MATAELPRRKNQAIQSLGRYTRASTRTRPPDHHFDCVDGGGPKIDPDGLGRLGGTGHHLETIARGASGPLGVARERPLQRVNRSHEENSAADGSTGWGWKAGRNRKRWLDPVP